PAWPAWACGRRAARERRGSRAAWLVGDMARGRRGARLLRSSRGTYVAAGALCERGRWPARCEGADPWRGRSGGAAGRLNQDGDGQGTQGGNAGDHRVWPGGVDGGDLRGTCEPRAGGLRGRADGGDAP